jgi:hypothetical protein
LNPFKAWNIFWFRPISARPLGVFRVLLGLIVLAHLVIVGCDLDHWMTDQGVLQGDEARIVAGPLRWSPLNWVQDPITVRVFMASTAVVAVAVIVGWHSRVSSVVLYLMMLSIHHRNILTNCGPDSLLMILLFYLMFSPSGASYSLDARRESKRRGTLAEPIIIPWAVRLIQVQMCMIYFSTSVFKANGATWLDGTAIHFVLQNVEVRRFNHEWLCQYPLFINFLTYISLLIEFGLVFLLWFRPTRFWAAMSGVALHIGAMLTVNVPLFGELMTVCYLTFLTPSELETFLRVVNPRNWFRRQARPSPRIPGRVDPAESLRGMHATVGEAGASMANEESEALWRSR